MSHQVTCKKIYTGGMVVVKNSCSQTVWSENTHVAYIKYHRRRATSNKVSTSSKYTFHNEINAAATVFDIPTDLIAAIIQVESNGDSRAISSAGAMGLMQLIPSTALDMGVQNIYDPAENIHGGTKYFSRMLKLFNGKIEYALAAFNAGPGAVNKYGGIPPYPETIRYVKNVMRTYSSLKNQL